MLAMNPKKVKLKIKFSKFSSEYEVKATYDIDFVKLHSEGSNLNKRIAILDALKKLEELYTYYMFYTNIPEENITDNTIIKEKIEKPIKIKEEIKEEAPDTCGKCKYYSVTPYRCHNEVGNESHCSLGSMNGEDMRDRLFYDSRYSGCALVKPKLIKRGR